MKALRFVLAIAAGLVALQASAQSRPSLDYTDMWWDPNESGWGLSIRQKVPAGGTIDALFAVWYTYDPRAFDPASPGGTGSVPLWFVMPGGTWTTPTNYQGTIYVTMGSPYGQAWNGASFSIQAVGTYRLQFTDAGHGVFTYDISSTAGLPSTNPAANLPPLSGTKNIVRQGF
jgi:hypothetical protein